MEEKNNISENRMMDIMKATIDVAFTGNPNAMKEMGLNDNIIKSAIDVYKTRKKKEWFKQ